MLWFLSAGIQVQERRWIKRRIKSPHSFSKIVWHMFRGGGGRGGTFKQVQKEKPQFLQSVMRYCWKINVLEQIAFLGDIFYNSEASTMGTSVNTLPFVACLVTKLLLSHLQEKKNIHFWERGWCFSVEQGHRKYWSDNRGLLGKGARKVTLHSSTIQSSWFILLLGVASQPYPKTCSFIGLCSMLPVLSSKWK